MQLQTILASCLDHPGAYEDRPFDLTTIVIKVKGKMFALFSDEDPVKNISLKCDPDYALALRAQYPAITGGYHLNKRHWNTVELNGTVPVEVIFELIDESYQLVVQKLTRRERAELGIE